MNKKLHKVDLIFIVGVTILCVLSGTIDAIYWKDVEYGGFPVFSMIGIFASYILWFVLLIYSFIKYKNKEEKPKYVKWYMYFVLPFFSIIITMVSMALVNFIINFLNL